MRRTGGTSGQASAEYVALLALVAVALALAAGLSSGGVGGQVLAGLQRGLCHVAPVRCPRPEPPRPDLVPCPLERTARDERLGATIGVVRLGKGGTLTTVRTSDGRVTVTLAEDDDAGAQASLGARLRLGRATLGGELTAAAGAAWTSGRSWTFASEAAARRFVDAYGRKATAGGRLLDDVRSRCSVLCDALGWDPHRQLPEPDETYEEGGLVGELSASFGPVRGGLDGSAVLGRRLARDGAATWYLRLSAEAAAALALDGLRLTGGAAAQALLAYELDAAGRPRALRVALAGEADAGLAAELAGATLSSGAGALVELEATLDLRDPANRAAASAVLAASGPLSLLDRLRSLGARIARRAQLDRRVYAVRRDAAGYGAGASAGAGLAGSLDTTTSSLRLLRADTRLPGLPFLPRDDCRAA